MSEKIVRLNEEVIKGQLKGISFEIAIIERYRRRESSVEEALIEMYLAGRIRPACGGHHRGSLGQQGRSIHYQRAEQESVCHIKEWRNRPL